MSLISRCFRPGKRAYSGVKEINRKGVIYHLNEAWLDLDDGEKSEGYGLVLVGMSEFPGPDAYMRTERVCPSVDECGRAAALYAKKKPAQIDDVYVCAACFHPSCIAYTPENISRLRDLGALVHPYVEGSKHDLKYKAFIQKGGPSSYGQ